jgi:protein ImuA
LQHLAAAKPLKIKTLFHGYFASIFFVLKFAKNISIGKDTMLATKEHIISELQRDILFMQGFKPISNATNDSGLDLIKEAFPCFTFPQAAIHEFFCNSAEENVASYGFISGIASSLMKTGTPSVWISSTKNIFPPALRQFKIDPHKIIFIQCQKQKEILWTIEEALKCDCISAVVGEINEISFTESRRLQLATEQSKVTGFLIRNNPKNLSTACVTRWSVKPLSTEKESALPGIGYPVWNVELLKIRNGKPGSWQMQWRKGKFELIQSSVHTYEQRARKIV